MIYTPKKQPAFFFILYACLMLIIFSQCRSSRPSEGALIGDIPLLIYPSVETEPTPRGKEKDSADDPAIWINQANNNKSIIFGSDKKGGIGAYNLEGEELAYYKFGNINNIDIRYDFVIGKDTFDILAGSNRSTHSINVWKINPNGTLESIKGGSKKSQLRDDVYGFCLNKNSAGRFFAFVNSKAGGVEQYEIIAQGTGINLYLVRHFNVHMQTEGMVCDDETSTLYLGKETAGIWKFGTTPIVSDTLGERIHMSSSYDNQAIVYDIEGLSIYKNAYNKGYLIASIQGNYSYAIFQLQAPHNYLGSFRIGASKDIDAVEETDGLETYSHSLPGFPKGILIVQDGFNYDKKGKKRAQNYKLISWEQFDSFLPYLE